MKAPRNRCTNDLCPRTDLTMTPWQTVDDKKERTLKYIIPVNNAMVKLKEAEVVEKQVIEKEDDYL